MHRSSMRGQSSSFSDRKGACDSGLWPWAGRGEIRVAGSFICCGSGFEAIQLRDKRNIKISLAAVWEMNRMWGKIERKKQLNVPSEKLSCAGLR